MDSLVQERQDDVTTLRNGRPLQSPPGDRRRRPIASGRAFGSGPL